MTNPYKGVPWREIAELNPRVQVVPLNDQQQRTLTVDLDVTVGLDNVSGTPYVEGDELWELPLILRDDTDPGVGTLSKPTMTTLEETQKLVREANDARPDRDLNCDAFPSPSYAVLFELAVVFLKIEDKDARESAEVSAEQVYGSYPRRFKS